MQISVTAADGAGERLDRHLQTKLPELSRVRIQDLIRDGHVTLNEKTSKPGAALRDGDTISISIPDPKPVEVVAQDIPLDVLFEDSHILVLNKPAGLVVHPADGNPDGTLVNALLYHCGDLSGIGGELRPGIVHRLDKETSGCMVVAKNDVAHQRLSEQFSDRRTVKIYLAVVSGVPKEKSGRIQNKIGRHPVDRKRMAVLLDGSGKEAVTEWELLSEHQGCALIQCRLLTGRTHQIRVHMREGLRHPIVDDIIYGHPSRQTVHTGRMMLHAWKLAFEHPHTRQPMSFHTPLPPEFAPWAQAAGLMAA
jgi:23S rRNA pseudouridine1911/1915/1917 synthase